MQGFIMMQQVVNIVTAGLKRFDVEQNTIPDAHQNTRRTKGAKMHSFVSDPVCERSFFFGTDFNFISKQFLYKIFGFSILWARMSLGNGPNLPKTGEIST
jgi:hypothetical protein